MVEVYRKDLATSYTVENAWVKNEDGVEEYRDLAWYRSKGYDTDSSVQGTDFGGSPSSPSPSSEEEANVDAGDYSEGLERARALFKFMPEAVQKEFANQWVKFGDTNLARAAVRNTQAWKDEFQYLERADGSLIMSELEAMATKATYRETLAEVGITDTTEFEKQFEQLIKGEVSGAEFQQRIDTVWSSVKDNIPQVEQMFREQYNISSDEPTIFAALINPDIQDKLLKGDLETLTIGAEAKAAGFTRSFSRFESLRKAGLTQDRARQVYQQAGTYQSMARQTDRTMDISTLEEAAIGDVQAMKDIGLLAAESASMSSVQTGAAKKDGKVSGLLES